MLYVTPPWPGFRECLFDGALEPNGLPSFNKPLMKLLREGHQVDFVILNSAYRPEYRQTNIKAEWLLGSRIHAIVETDIRLHKKIFTYLRLIEAVKKAITDQEYDFIYAQGSSTAVVRGLARRNHIPFGQRLYGTFLWEKIQKQGRTRVSIRHITEYRSFITPKSFLLVTNDGSGGDHVLQAIWKGKKPPFEFCHWLNGVNPMPEVPASMLESTAARLGNKPFIFYAARFDAWKRQDRAVRIIAELKKRGEEVHLFLAGPHKTVGTSFFDQVMELVKEQEVEDRVTYMGNVDAATINIMCKLALATLSLYDVCNLTNVFHEMLSAGAVAIVQKDGTTDGFIEHGKNGFHVNSDSEAVEIILKLLHEPDGIGKIREEAMRTSRTIMKTWDQRSQEEIDLIKKYATREIGS
jgi:glycosyltransferase involved in cell wall biosynthesis